MTVTGDYLLIGLVILALGLTFVALRVGLILFRVVAAISWLALGILFWTNQLGTSIGDPWVRVLSFVFLGMTVAVLTLQMKTDILHERSVRGKLGMPGAQKESWTTWGPNPKKKKTLSSSERQAEYRQMLSGRRK